MSAVARIPAGGPVAALLSGHVLGDRRVDVYFAPAGYSADGLTAEGFTAYEVARFRAAFRELEAVADLRFRETRDPAAAEFRLLFDADEGLSGAYMSFPGGDGIGAFNWEGASRAPGGALEPGGVHFSIVIHELLHGLGLAHPHDGTLMAGVQGPYDLGAFRLNQNVHTSMSYNWGYTPPGAGTANFGWSYGNETTPMALDIAALQSLYGPNPTHAGGDDTYRLESAGTGHWEAIWDTGGHDRILYAGGQDATIDLRAATLVYGPGGGGFLSAAGRGGSETGGVTIAHGVVIEEGQGGTGADVIIGNAADNRLWGGRGADRITGGAGDDMIRGQNAADRIEGGRGHDRLHGGNGPDLVKGARGHDRIHAGDGYDRAMGGGGHDTVFTGNGDDTAWGGPGDDRLRLGRGDDIALAGHHDDRVTAGRGGDVLRGERGHDRLWGEAGDDRLFGGRGHDWLDGGRGDDTMTGDGGRDTFVFRAGADVITDFERAEDRLRLDAAPLSAEVTGDGLLLALPTGTLLLAGLDALPDFEIF